MEEIDKSYTMKRYIFFWITYAIQYLFPTIFYSIRLGITKQKVALVIPVVILMFLAVLKLALSIPSFVASWKPSIKKGLILAIPKFLLFICLMTLGVSLQYLLKKQIELSMYNYFECIIVVFGAACVASVFGALHLKYKELDLIQHGYVLGVVNKNG